MLYKWWGSPQEMLILPAVTPGRPLAEPGFSVTLPFEKGGKQYLR